MDTDKPEISKPLVWSKQKYDEKSTALGSNYLVEILCTCLVLNSSELKYHLTDAQVKLDGQVVITSSKKSWHETSV